MTTEIDIIEAIHRGIQLGVRDALRERKRMGRSVVIWRDGQVVELPPEEIPDFEEETTAPNS